MNVITTSPLTGVLSFLVFNKNKISVHTGKNKILYSIQTLQMHHGDQQKKPSSTTTTHTHRKKGTEILLFRTKHKSILTFYIPIYVSNMYCFPLLPSILARILGIYPILYVHRLSHIIAHVPTNKIGKQEVLYTYLLLDSFFFGSTSLGYLFFWDISH